ncbi:hypothetical protein [Herbidospora sp. RD11066]
MNSAKAVAAVAVAAVAVTSGVVGVVLVTSVPGPTVTVPEIVAPVALVEGRDVAFRGFEPGETVVVTDGAREVLRFTADDLGQGRVTRFHRHIPRDAERHDLVVTGQETGWEARFMYFANSETDPPSVFER